METKVRIRVGNVEIEVAGEEEFVVNRLPGLVSDLMGRLGIKNIPETPPPPPSDGPSSDTTDVSISGSVRDYWSNAPVTGAAVTTMGLAPALIGLSDEVSRFILSGRSTGERYSLLIRGPSGYMETINPVELLTGPAALIAVAAATPDIDRQYTSLGLARTPDMATILIELLDSDGAPLEGVSTGDIKLTTANDTAAGSGPFFFGAHGDIQNQADMPKSRTFANRARAAFINVPTGEYFLQVKAAGAGNVQTRAVVAVPAAGGVTVVRARQGQ